MRFQYLMWEQMHKTPYVTTMRMKVPGGWLIKVTETTLIRTHEKEKETPAAVSVVMTFVPSVPRKRSSK